MNCHQVIGIIFVAVAITLTIQPSNAAEPTLPVPNATNLSGLAGKYTGRSKVTLESKTNYSGGSKIGIVASTDLSLKIKIVARVNAPTGYVSINNQFTFSQSGTMRCSELAPGISKHAPFGGIYTATPHHINFSGDFKFGKAKGTIVGYVSLNPKGRLFVKYSIFVKDTTAVIYEYNYSGKIKYPKK